MRLEIASEHGQSTCQKITVALLGQYPGLATFMARVNLRAFLFLLLFHTAKD
jgi:hypothetical protein